MTPRVGIDKIRVYPAALTLHMPDLCAARGHDPADIRDNMLIDERSVNPPWEDPVTMAVNAALPLLTEEDKKSIEYLLVASESGVDQEKPMSTWVQRYLGLPASVRNLEVKHACYGGTGSVQLAAGLLASHMVPEGAKALVITTDQSRMHFNKPWEYVKGAAATAILVSRDPRMLELEPGKYGVHTNEVNDLTRPTSRVETGNSEVSLISYLDGLEGALDAYLAKLPEPIGYDYFAKNIYHTPFGGITVHATRTAMRAFGGITKAEAKKLWEQKTQPSLKHVRRIGGTYSSSTFIDLVGLFDNCPELKQGDRIGIYSYGSGSCAEFYSGLVGPRAHEMAAAAELGRVLDARKRITVREYEECERERTCYIDCGDFDVSTNGLGGFYDEHYRGKNKLVFKGCKEHFREYAWS
jgi:3-hydroxy-3-methylglutaryl CoA synthase